MYAKRDKEPTSKEPCYVRGRGLLPTCSLLPLALARTRTARTVLARTMYQKSARAMASERDRVVFLQLYI